MKKTCILMTAVLVLLAMAASCSSDEPNEPNEPNDPKVPVAELSVDPASINATTGAGNYTIALTSNVAWTATDDAEWLTLTPAAGTGNGTITATVTENTALDQRTATITLAAGELTKAVTVTQAGITAALAVSPASIDAESQADNYTLTVTSNVAWTATITAEWLTLDPAAGTGNGTINVALTGNTTVEARSATITVTAGALTETVAIVQEAAPASTTPPHAVSTQIWTIGDQTWSDVIHIPECNKSDFVKSYTDPHCRSYTHDGITDYYYNWPYVDQKAADLCPAPWRIPTTDDFIALDMAMGGNGGTRYEGEDWVIEHYINRWGGTYCGLVDGDGTLYNVGTAGHYWSSTPFSDTYANYMVFTASGYVRPQDNPYKYYGFPVRCVQVQ